MSQPVEMIADNSGVLWNRGDRHSPLPFFTSEFDCRAVLLTVPISNDSDVGAKAGRRQSSEPIHAEIVEELSGDRTRTLIIRGPNNGGTARTPTIYTTSANVLTRSTYASR